MVNNTESSVSSSPPAAFALRAGFSDLDELTRAIEGWGLEWVQLDRGPLEARVQQVGSGETLVSRFSFDRKFHQRGTSPPGVRTFDLTPKQYLRAVRLQGVHRELLIFRGREPISAVALRWGFWHMSQFARDYRRTFGELPSETARGA